MTDAPVSAVVVAEPGRSIAGQVAAQVAVANGLTNKVDAVDKQLLETVGVKTHGWTKDAAKIWWKEHSTQIWGLVTVIELTMTFVGSYIPKEWTTLSHAVAAIGGFAGMILKYRVQLSVALDRIRAEVARSDE